MMKLKDIPKILDQKEFNEKRSTLSGWFFINNVIIPEHPSCQFGENRSLKEWFVFLKKGIIHKEDGFAAVKMSGSYVGQYFINNNLHALNSPANFSVDRPLIWTGYDFRLDPDSKILSRCYHQNGVIHRLDGPAMIIDRNVYFSIEGFSYDEEEFLNDPRVVNNRIKQHVLDIIRES